MTEQIEWRNRIVESGVKPASQFMAHPSKFQPARCAYCGKDILVESRRIRLFGADHVYCSREHFGAMQKLRALKTFTCEQCGKQFQTKQSRKQGAHVFCSLSCAAIYRNKSTEVVVSCDWCGKQYRVPPSKEHQNAHFYCSTECRANHIMGVNNPAYRSGWGRKREYASNWKRQRRAALERDNKACVVCGKSPALPRYLHVHHIRPAYLFNGDWEKANDLSNLITLCAKCHKDVELKKVELSKIKVTP